MLFDVQIGDVVQLRKTHPCGSQEWLVTRIGADIGLKCQGCGRKVMLTRRAFNKSVKRCVSRPLANPQDEGTPAQDERPDAPAR
ncbi:MAG: DUF951 domain-containing protein [Chloroflexi bacterium]|nr:DUF951 domain-containing protein [Chloroflexota bacterium]